MAILAFGLLATTSPMIFAQGGTISLNKKRIRIEQLVQMVGEATERTILLPDNVRGTISIVAKRPVSHEEAWAILDSSLSILGFSLLPSTVGNWRISKVAEAVGEAPFREELEGNSDSYVTTLIPLRSADLQNVLNVLEPLAGSRVTLVPYEATNSLIASGSERAIARLTGLADELDRVEEETLRIRVLRYRDVNEVESFVETFLESLGARGRGLQVWSDERTNSIVVRGYGESFDRVMSFLDEVDRPIEGGGSIQILRVLNRDAEEVAELIRSFADPAGGASSAVAASATALSGADYSIAVDGPSRSLVVRADPEVQTIIRELLEILDVQPQLIAVDVIVSELRTPTNYGLSFGFEIPFSTGNDSSSFSGLIQNQANLTAAQAAPALVGRVARDSGVSFQQDGPNGTTVSVPLLQTGTIAATDFKGSNEVLIQPSLVVIAGDRHEIFAGRNIPIPTSDGGGITDADGGTFSSSTLARTTTFERQDIGARLSIEARAGKEGKIQLDLDLEVSTIDPSRASLGGDPTQVGVAYVEQNLTVRALLEDGESAILSTVRDEKETRIRTGVPFFMDLPLIGRLFRTDGAIIEDVRLVIVARAKRVSSPSELVADTIRRRLAFERRSARGATLPQAKGSPYGVRVTTRSREDDARAIADSLALRGYLTKTHRWSVSGKEYFDVYVTELDSMVDAADVAEVLAREGWQTDLVVLSTRS